MLKDLFLSTVVVFVTTPQSLLQHIWTRWWPIHLILPEPLFYIVSPMNPALVILEYAQAHAILEGEIY